MTQIHCAGDLTANINLTKSRILTGSDYYPLQNLRSCDSVYTLQLTVEASTVIFEAATAHLKALIAAAKKVDEEVNTQVEVDDDEQNNSSDSEVLDEDVGRDMGNVVQPISRASNTNTIKCRDRALII